MFKYDTKNNVSEKNLYKTKGNPITNSPDSFQNIATITGLHDFHKMVVPVLKAVFTKIKSNVITYRDYKLFNEENV